MVFGFNNMSYLVGHFVSSLREREKRDSSGDEREGQRIKRKNNESEERGPATRIADLAQL